MEYSDKRGELWALLEDQDDSGRIDALEAQVAKLEEIVEVHMERLYDLERGELFDDEG